jgi:hypothetical protein
VKVYLDVCCLNRPFDDQTQQRVRDEAEAVAAILVFADKGVLDVVGSQMMRIELKSIKDPERRRRVRACCRGTCWRWMPKSLIEREI